MFSWEISPLRFSFIIPHCRGKATEIWIPSKNATVFSRNGGIFPAGVHNLVENCFQPIHGEFKFSGYLNDRKVAEAVSRFLSPP